MAALRTLILGPIFASFLLGAKAGAAIEVKSVRNLYGDLS